MGARLIAVGLSLALFALGAAPPPPAVSPAPSQADEAADATDVEGVVVKGAPTEKLVDRFVEGVSATTKRGRLGRWDRAVCPAVVGLRGAQGRYVNERIADTAFSLGLKVGDEGCRAHLIVLVTPEPDEAARRLVTEYRARMAIRPRGNQLATGGGGQSTEAFMTSDKPVRWWHVALTEPANGDSTTSVGGMNVMSSPGGRLASPTRETFIGVTIVVDGRRLRGLSYEQLASYLSMVGLAQIDPDASVGGLSSILTVFDDVAAGRPAAETLTDWDKAYLEGLYKSRADAPNAFSQKDAIAGRMLKDAKAGE